MIFGYVRLYFYVTIQYTAAFFTKHSSIKYLRFVQPSNSFHLTRTKRLICRPTKGSKLRSKTKIFLFFSLQSWSDKCAETSAGKWREIIALFFKISLLGFFRRPGIRSITYFGYTNRIWSCQTFILFGYFFLDKLLCMAINLSPVH